MIADQPYGAATAGNPCEAFHCRAHNGPGLRNSLAQGASPRGPCAIEMLRCWTRLPPYDGEAGSAFGIRADGWSANAIQYGIGKGYNHIFHHNYVQSCHDTGGAIYSY